MSRIKSGRLGKVSCKFIVSSLTELAKNTKLPIMKSDNHKVRTVSLVLLSCEFVQLTSSTHLKTFQEFLGLRLSLPRLCFELPIARPVGGSSALHLLFGHFSWAPSAWAAGSVHPSSGQSGVMQNCIPCLAVRQTTGAAVSFRGPLA